MRVQAVFSLVASSVVGVAAVSVETSFGKLVGEKKHLEGCDAFLGIPFAKAPVGDLRFEDPLPWEAQYPAEGFQATTFGAACPQMLPPSFDEDCLFLNLWRPAGGGDALPAMVFIYGGGFISGAGSASVIGPIGPNLYDGCGFTSHQKVLVANMNYRLGALGFGVFGEGGKASANFAMKDQRSALQWLHRELPAFGGDPAKVTIFGESAGGMSVFYHVASPASGGLFRAAISESGFPMAWSWDYGRSNTIAFAAQLGCTDPESLKACLRAVPAAYLVGNQTGTIGPDDFQTGQPPWQPVVDGSDMPRYPRALFQDGQVNPVPILAGSNTDEVNLFVWPIYEGGMNKSQFDEYLLQLLANHDPLPALEADEFAEVRAAYAVDDPAMGDMRQVAAKIATHSSFQCGTYASGQESKNDFFLYRFNHRSACQFWLRKWMPGVFHTSELPYVFDAPAKEGCVWTPAEAALSKRMQGMWANFAKCLNPTCGEEGFPQYSNASRQALVFQTPADEVEEDYLGDKCDMFNRLIFEKFRGKSGGPVSPKALVV